MKQNRLLAAVSASLGAMGAYAQRVIPQHRTLRGLDFLDRSLARIDGIGHKTNRNSRHRISVATAKRASIKRKNVARHKQHVTRAARRSGR